MDNWNQVSGYGWEHPSGWAIALMNVLGEPGYMLSREKLHSRTVRFTVGRKSTPCNLGAELRSGRGRLCRVDGRSE